MSTDQELLDLAMVKVREARAEAAEAQGKLAELVDLAAELHAATIQNDAAKTVFDVMRADVDTAYPAKVRRGVSNILDKAQSRLCAAQDAWMAAGLTWAAEAVEAGGRG